MPPIWNALLQLLLPHVYYPLLSRRLDAQASARNLRENQRQDISGRVIPSQSAAEIARFRYAGTAASDTGCGAIAAYNALTVLGRRASLAEVIHRVERARGVMRGGRHGANPYALGAVLRGYGAAVRRVRRLRALERVLEPGDAAILMIWNDRADIFRGAHFFTVQKTAEGYAVHNREARMPGTASLEDIVAGGRFITGYWVRGAGELRSV